MAPPNGRRRHCSWATACAVRTSVERTSQLCLVGGTTDDEALLFFASAFACLSARFSFSDFPDFCDMDWRGDLSAMRLLPRGSLDGLDASTVRRFGERKRRPTGRSPSGPSRPG